MYENVPTEHQQVLAALERLQAKLIQKEEWAHSHTLGALRDTLQRPLLAHMLTLQHSIKQLREQLNNLPADACSDFSFSRKGQLIVSLATPTQSPVQAPPTKSSVLAMPTQSSALANGNLPLSPEQLERWIQSAAKGQRTEAVGLSRPAAGGGLGFSVAALRSEGVQRGFFIKHIQPGGVAHRDGRLQERDQILVINGSPLQPDVSQHQALSLLQQPGDRVELVVARDRPHASPPQATPTPAEQLWGHLEQIELLNDGSGLGFGIVGSRSSGVVVRTLVPGSVADKDGRLRTGDHILRIGDTPTGGLSSDQVVKVLQGCGSQVCLLIARDPRAQAHLSLLPPPPPSSAPVSTRPALPANPPALTQRRVSKTPNLEGYQIHEVSLTRREGQSLGISIIGYNAYTSQDAVGVFVKHVVPGSAAEQSGNIRVHDRLIALDGVSLQGFTNQEVLEVMKQSGQTVQLTLVRKTRTLERSLDRVDRQTSHLSLNRPVEVKTLVSAAERTDTSRDQRHQEVSSESEQEVKSKWEQALGPQYQVMLLQVDPIIEDDEELQKFSKLLPIHTMRLGVELDSFDGHHYISSVAAGGPLEREEREGRIRAEDELLEVNGLQLYGKSRREAVAFLREVPPPFTLVCCRHHNQNQDRLEGEAWTPTTLEPEAWTPTTLENQDRLEPEAWTPTTLENQDRLEPEAWRPTTLENQDRLEPEAWTPTILENQNLEPEAWTPTTLENQDRLEGEAWTPTPALEEIEVKLSALLSNQQDIKESFNSQQGPMPPDPSLGSMQEEEGEEEEEELALWSPDVLLLDLQKDSDKGLGFSLLDYQDPVDAGCCVMVIRSLVPGGAAERHRGLLPGDQLVSVNETRLDHMTLAQAVEVLKAAPSGLVRLGIRKPLVGTEGETFQKTPSERDITVDRLSLSVLNTLPVPKGFGDGSILPEDLREACEEEEEEEDEERELILDGGLPRYTSVMNSDPLGHDLPPPPAPPLLPREGLEMTVDEDADGGREEDGIPLPPSFPAPPPYFSLTAGEPQSDEEDQRDMNQEREESQVQATGQNDTLVQGTSLVSWTDSRDSDADSELTLTDTDTESRSVERRSHGRSAPPIRGGPRYLPEREDGEGEETPAFSHWGQPRRVEVFLEPGQSLGISIVGGRHVIKRLRNGEELRGIFIKQVLPDSPADKTNSLKTGDKILEVCGVDLQTASHEEAVQAIKSAPSLVVFTVQSLATTPRKVTLSQTSMRLPPPYQPFSQSEPPYQPSSQSEPPYQPSSQPEPPYQPSSQSEHEADPELQHTRGRDA